MDGTWLTGRVEGPGPALGTAGLNLKCCFALPQCIFLLLMIMNGEAPRSSLEVDMTNYFCSAQILDQWEAEMERTFHLWSTARCTSLPVSLQGGLSAEV